MSVLDRLLGRKPASNNYTLTVSSDRPVDPPKPHNFCGHCGEPMVDGYMVLGRAFDRATGQRVLEINRRRLCLTLHKQEKPKRLVDEDGDPIPNALEDHDGYPRYSIFDSWAWGMGAQTPRETIPDCEVPA